MNGARDNRDFSVTGKSQLDAANLGRVQGMLARQILIRLDKRGALWFAPACQPSPGPPSQVSGAGRGNNAFSSVYLTNL
jgi:hypothetical protein